MYVRKVSRRIGVMINNEITISMGCCRFACRIMRNCSIDRLDQHDLRVRVARRKAKFSFIEAASSRLPRRCLDIALAYESLPCIVYA